MRIVVAALLLSISVPAFADKPAPPIIRLTPDQEVELPKFTSPYDLLPDVQPREQGDSEPKSRCTLTQGSRHIDGDEHDGPQCNVHLDAHVGFVPGPATLAARTSLNGVWSEPSTVEVQLVMPGNLWMQTSSSQNLVWTMSTSSARLSNGVLSLVLFTQGGDMDGPSYPFLGRISVTVPPNGKIDQVVPLDARWLDPLARSSGWKKLFRGQADALLAAKALHVTGTYSAKTGAELTFEVPGVGGSAFMAFRPSNYKVDVNFIDCDKLSVAQRKLHSICE